MGEGDDDDGDGDMTTTTTTTSASILPATTTTTTTTTATTINPYLAMRAEKIARNEARLKSLGLWKKPSSQSIVSSSSTRSRNSRHNTHRNRNRNSTNKRKQTQTNNHDDITTDKNDGVFPSLPPPPRPHRRSKRIMEQPQRPNYKEHNVNVNVSSSSSSTWKTTNAHTNAAAHPTTSITTVATTFAKQQQQQQNHTTTSSVPSSMSSSSSLSPSTTTTLKNVKPNSVRLIQLDTVRLIDRLLGVDLLSHNTGKDYIIHRSFQLAATTKDKVRLGYYNDQDHNSYNDNDHDHDHDPQNNDYYTALDPNLPRLSFNKYSGVQQWNNVIFLWVNLHSNNNNNNIQNDFLNGGRQITWYGGSRMTDDSHPIIQSMIRIGINSQQRHNDNQQRQQQQQRKQPVVASSAAAATDSESIVLWCRRYDNDTKSYTPYVCLGRMGYHSHVPQSYPIEFIWNLLDYDKLVLLCNSSGGGSDCGSGDGDGNVSTPHHRYYRSDIPDMLGVI